MLTAFILAVAQGLFPAAQISDLLRPGKPIAAAVFNKEGGDFPGAAAREQLDSLTWRASIEAMSVPSRPPGVRFVPAHTSYILLQLRGLRSQPVDIVDMRVRVLKHQDPLRGTLLTDIGPQGGSSALYWDIAVDKPAPGLVDHQTGEPYFPGHHITVAKDEMVAITLKTTAARWYTDWDLAADYVVGGSHGSLYIGAGGVVPSSIDDHPFRITALPQHMRDYGAIYGWSFNANELGAHYKFMPSDQACSAFFQPVFGRVPGYEGLGC